VVLALEMGEVETLTPIRLRYTGEVIDLTQAYDDQDVNHTEPTHIVREYLNTTVGRAILNDHLPKAVPGVNLAMPYINGLLKKKGIGQLVNYCYLRFGLEVTVKMLDEIKSLGFKYATRSGLSIGIDDMVIPDNKKTLVKDADKLVIAVQQQYLDGAITNGERYNKVIEIWSAITEKVADEMFGQMQTRDKQGVLNPIYVMADSGARGSKQQIRQLSGMRGLMAKPTGEIIETPITANFREGLTVLEYFISTHGARKGLADTALKTADSGYLTRRLVDVAQDVIISEYDCGTVDGIFVSGIVEAGEIIEPLRDRIVGRVSLEKIKDYEGKVVVDINQEITEDLAGAIQAAGIERVKIRSVLTCESKRGVCVMCYGRNLASGRLVELGEATGVIAAQSIGEPGTQLTMRTFHIGGTASRVSEQSRLDAKSNGLVRFINLQTVKSKTGDLVVMNRQGSIAVVDEKGRERERYAVVYGAKVKVTEGGPVQLGEALVEWDPYTFAILTEIGGTAQFKDLQEGITCTKKSMKSPASRVTWWPIRPTRSVSRPSSSRARRASDTSCLRVLTSWCRTETRCSPATCWPRSRAKRPRPRTSRAVCRVWSNCSRLASRARPPSSAKSMAWFASAKWPRDSANSTWQPTTARRRNIPFRAAFTSTCRKASASRRANR
jgi:DNA-directed RNA polymerase subunit beta'